MSKQSEKLFDGVTHIDDALIEKAQNTKKKKPAWRRWMAPIAAAVALAIGLGVLLNPAGGPLATNAYAIAVAEYPQQPQYPGPAKFLRGEDSNAFQEEYQKWSEGVRATMNVTGADAVAAFGADVTRQFLAGAGEENRVVSPLNLYMALAMLSELTEGESREQVFSLLRSEDMEALRQQAGEVWSAAYRDDGASACLLASSVWLNKNIKFVQKTMDTLAKDYYASSYRGEMGSEDFNQALRDWLNAQTGGLLEEQAQDFALDADTLLALATTVWFRAKWHSEFAPKNTKPGVFHSPVGDVDCNMMFSRWATHSYYWGEKFSAVNLYFEGRMGTMWLILPDEGVTTDELLSDEEAMAFLQSGEKWENVARPIINLTLPKFDVSSDLDLIEGLQALGVTDVFDPYRSDFTPMTTDRDDVFLSQAKHAVRVSVDEEGCTAAAYTVLAGAESTAPVGEEIDFTLDRPFLFSIQTPAGLPIFTGVVNRPVE